MTRAALEQRVDDLEGQVAQLTIMVEEARVLASAERAAADAMQVRMTACLGGGIAWIEAAEC